MSQTTPEVASILEALKTVQDPDLHRDIVELGFVKNLEISGGRVSFAIELTTPACPVKDRLRDEARAAVMRVPGVTSVDVSMTASVRTAVRHDGGPAPIAGIRNVVAVGAGKGGVGKTTVAVNLAIALAGTGSRVGLIDGDIYGPNVPVMLGLEAQLLSDGEKILPAEAFGIKVVSMGFLADSDVPVIWRGPMLHSVIQQFLHEVSWGELDYLVVDMPPGTGDVVLSLSQTVPVAGAIVVTTPQAVSLVDSRKAVRMYQKLNIPVLGIVENMSYFACPNCAHESDIFGRGGAERLAVDVAVPFLGQLPIYQPIRVGSDTGRPIVVAEPDSPVARAFVSIAERTAAEVSMAAYRKPTISITPTM